MTKERQQWWSRLQNADGSLSEHPSLLAFRNTTWTSADDVYVCVPLCVYMHLCKFDFVGVEKSKVPGF